MIDTDPFISLFLYYRCNVAVMLLTDIVVAGIPEVDWTLHLPTMLHILFLGLDHTRPIVRDHCKQLVLNLLVRNVYLILPFNRLIHLIRMTRKTKEKTPNYLSLLDRISRTQ